MRKRKLRWLLPPVLLLALLTAAWLRLEPAIEDMAAARVADEASDLIAEAITAQMERDGVCYDSVVALEKDAQGRLLALRTDMNRLNRLRNKTLDIINERITGGGESELGIPLGSVLFPALLSGKGPRLPVRVLTVSNCDAEFYSGFREAGINQTLHRITMQVAMNITLLTPAGTQQVKVDSGVVVAETILIGQVPQTLIRPQKEGTEE